MKVFSLKARLLASFFLVIGILSVLMGAFGFYVIKKNILQRAQRQVTKNLSIAYYIYNSDIEKMEEAFKLIDVNSDVEQVRDVVKLDYLRKLSAEEAAASKSEIVGFALKNKKGSGGSRLAGEDELEALGIKRYQPLISGRAMLMEYAYPKIYGGEVVYVISGGVVINGNNELVDRISDIVFEKQIYNGKPVGTVTFFADDTRIATNVLDKNNNRAIGTKVSNIVYQNVLKKGGLFLDRAFVVTDYYLSAYMPIKDVNGKIIGMLYAGFLEKLYGDLFKKSFFIFISFVLAAGIAAFIIALFITSSVTKPLQSVMLAASSLSGGELSHRVDTSTTVRELNLLGTAFNDMARQLEDRHNKVVELNKTYLDLIGFVSHELKGILASTILNAYTVRDGFLGLVNFKQQKALDMVVRNLDYLDTTVKNFLNLSRIEKGELAIEKKETLFKEDVVDVSLEAFSKQISDKNIRLKLSLQAGVKILADTELLIVVMNNLIGNAVKYSSENAQLAVNMNSTGGKLRVEVYNEGPVISAEESQKLFKKFSRILRDGVKKQRGTGLGLFLSREIIEKHGGRIWFEPREKGNSFIFSLTI